MAIEENNDFLNQKNERGVVQKPNEKTVTERKKTSVKKGFDVPEMSRSLTELEKESTRKKYDFVINKIKEVEKRDIDEKYKAYKELDLYSRKCLIATNYWRVMWGDNFIDVPTQDIRFWFYFDEKCFINAPIWQKLKKPEFEERNKLEAEKETEALRIKEESVTVKSTQVIEPVIEQKIETEKKPEDMPIEENKDFLSQKQEHPVYPKKEKLDENNQGKKERENTESKPENETKHEPEQKKKPKPKGKGKKKNDDTQYNLF